MPIWKYLIRCFGINYEDHRRSIRKTRKRKTKRKKRIKKFVDELDKAINLEIENKTPVSDEIIKSDKSPFSSILEQELKKRKSSRRRSKSRSSSISISKSKEGSKQNEEITSTEKNDEKAKSMIKESLLKIKNRINNSRLSNREKTKENIKENIKENVKENNEANIKGEQDGQMHNLCEMYSKQIPFLFEQKTYKFAIDEKIKNSLKNSSSNFEYEYMNTRSPSKERARDHQNEIKIKVQNSQKIDSQLNNKNETKNLDKNTSINSDSTSIGGLSRQVPYIKVLTDLNKEVPPTTDVTISRQRLNDFDEMKIKAIYKNLFENLLKNIKMKKDENPNILDLNDKQRKSFDQNQNDLTIDKEKTLSGTIQSRISISTNSKSLEATSAFGMQSKDLRNEVSVTSNPNVSLTNIVKRIEEQKRRDSNTNPNKRTNTLCDIMLNKFSRININKMKTKSDQKVKGNTPIKQNKISKK